jgi:pyruvate kinase
MDMLCSTATQIALDNNVDLFVILTDTGKIARYLAKQRPMRTILACSTKQQVVRQCNTSRGVIGYKVPEHIKKHQEKLLSLVMMVMKEQGFCL